MTKIKKDKKIVYTGIMFYKDIGKISLELGVLWSIIMFFILLLPQDYEKYSIPLIVGIFTAIIILHFIIGAIFLLLCKYSKNFQEFAEHDFENFNEKYPGYFQ